MSSECCDVDLGLGSDKLTGQVGGEVASREEGWGDPA